MDQGASHRIGGPLSDTSYAPRVPDKRSPANEGRPLSCLGLHECELDRKELHNGPLRHPATAAIHGQPSLACTE